MKSNAFGKGIQALLGDKNPGIDSEKDRNTVPIDAVLPNPYQPRSVFSESELEELADSIRSNGLLQPIVVRKVGDQFELIAGERRTRAAKLAGLTSVPAHVLQIDDEKMLELSIVENVQRENLNPVEEAEAYVRLEKEFNRTHDEIAKIVGKSRSHVSNMIRLLNLPDPVRQILQQGKITMGHARSLLPLDDPDKQIELAEAIAKGSLSVRESESRVSAIVAKRRGRKRSKATDSEKLDVSSKTPNQTALEEELMRILGTGVRIIQKKNKGALEIDFYSDDDLDRIVTLLRTL